jgi:hypothetical protein
MRQPEEVIIQKILSSSEFVNSPNYQKLLEFLVKSSQEGKVPKELTIAYEVYHIDIQDKSVAESNVRVYVHNLRKKLDSYYQNEGKTDRLQLAIPKGKYKVEFVEHNIKSFRTNRKFLILALLIAVGVTIINILITKDIIHIIKQKNTASFSRHVWRDFIETDLPLLIVIGDYYLFKDMEYPDRVRYLRDVRINSDRELDLFLQGNPDKSERYNITKHSLIGKFSVFCIYDLVEMFLMAGKKVKIILASDFNWEDMKENNIIYVGSFKAMRQMDEFIKYANFKFNVYPNELRFKQLVPDSTFYYYSVDSDMDNAYESDYSIVAKMPGPSGNTVMFFISTRDIGSIATVDYFTNPDKIKEFESVHFKQDGNNLDYFESCFMVQGLHRNPVDISLLNMNKIQSPSFFKQPFSE